MTQRRYPGIRPFEANESHLFFGRQRDVRDLNVLLSLEKLVVLFGRSGYGKSSLINAGILPLLQKIELFDENPLIPIMVRLGSYNPGSTLSPVENLLSKLKEIVPEPSAPHFLDTLVLQPSLWHHFKRRQTHAEISNAEPKYQRYLLIFDQFEEFFTYPPVEQEVFKQQLSELIYSEIPQSVRALTTNLTKAERAVLIDPLEVKVLFAIRADRMNLLHAMGNKFPAILDKRNRFELRGLSAEQAEEAICKPAQEEGKFESPKFEYSREAISTIKDKLAETKLGEERGGIETFQLQILCEYLEAEILAGNIENNVIEPKHFAEKFNVIYEGYYQRLLNKLPAAGAPAAQILIEESLIFEDEKTGEPRRLSIDADLLVQRYDDIGITHDTLRQLENTFLLRRDINSVGGYSYEVSHDTLLGAIINLKKERKAKEAIAAERIRTRKKQRRLFAFFSLIFLIFAIAVGIIIYVLKLKRDLEASYKLAQERLGAYEERDIAIKARDTEEAAKVWAEIQDLITRANWLKKNNHPKEAKFLINEAMKKLDQYPNNTILQEKRKLITE